MPSSALGMDMAPNQRDTGPAFLEDIGVDGNKQTNNNQINIMMEINRIYSHVGFKIIYSIYMS